MDGDVGDSKSGAMLRVWRASRALAVQKSWPLPMVMWWVGDCSQGVQRSAMAANCFMSASEMMPWGRMGRRPMRVPPAWRYWWASWSAARGRTRDFGRTKAL